MSDNDFAMPYLRDTAIVLNVEPLREHDAWIDLYGLAYGKLSVVTRGMRRWQAKQRGHVEIFNEVQVMIAKGLSADVLAVAHVSRPRPGLRQRLDLMAIAGSSCHLIDQLTRPELPDPAIYRLLSELLDMGNVPHPELTPERAQLLLAAVRLKLLILLGYAPQLDRCARCQTTVADQQSTGMHLSVSLGGFVCDRCAGDMRRHCLDLRRLPALSLRLFRFLRACSLAEVLQLTATAQLFLSVSQTVDELLQSTPLHKPSHGFSTVAALLAR